MVVVVLPGGKSSRYCLNRSGGCHVDSQTHAVSQTLERLLLIVGLLMLGFYAIARIQGEVLSRAEVQRFVALQATGQEGAAPQARLLRGPPRGDRRPCARRGLRVGRAPRPVCPGARSRLGGGPDPEPHVASIRAYLDAGFDQVYIHQVGPDQAGFLEFARRELLPALERQPVKTR